MKRVCILLFGFALICSSASAQVTYDTVTATVIDPNAAPLANAAFQITLVDANGLSVSSATTPNGQLFNAKPVSGTLDAAGHLSVNLVPNNTLSKPGGTQWKIVISAPTDSSILVYQQAWTITYATAITANVDLSSQLSALATAPVAYMNLKTGQSSVTANDPTARANAAAALAAANAALPANGVTTSAGGNMNVPGTVAAVPLMPPSASYFDCEGDSITFGYGVAPASARYCDVAQTLSALNGRGYIYTNYAQSGNTVADLTTRYTAGGVKAHCQTHSSILSVWVGTNDLGNGGRTAAATFADLTAYWTQAQTDGCKVVAYTIAPRSAGTFGWTPAQETQRQLLNESIRASSIPQYIVDTEALLPDSTNIAVYGDGLHPTAAGHLRLAEALDAVLRGTRQINPLGSLTSGGGAIPYATYSVSHTLGASEGIVNFFGGGALTLTLPSITNNGPYYVTNSDPAYTLTIAPGVGATLFSVPTSLPPKSGIVIQQSGGFWVTIASFGLPSAQLPATSLALSSVTYSASHTLASTDSVINFYGGNPTLTLPNLTSGSYGPFFITNSGPTYPLTIAAGSGAVLFSVPTSIPVNSAVVLIQQTGGFWVTAASYGIGFTGTKTAGTCVMAITGGVIMSVTGC